MTEIVAGELRYNELTANAHGGTEQMARRMVRDIPQDLLKGFQIVHSRVRNLDPNLKKILVCHDLATDPEVAVLADPEYRKQFEKIVFVSNWQQHTYNLVCGIPFSESYVIRNGIEIKPFQPRYNEGPIRLIYHTTPHRGLEILVPVFEALSQTFDLHLDVFSSFEIYGWKERDVPYKPLFDKLANMDNVTLHGFQSNDVVRSFLDRSHVFAYPSIWPETSCIAMIEALTAGNYVVNSNLGALPETGMQLTAQYMFTEDKNEHARTFYDAMYQVLSHIVLMREHEVDPVQNHIASTSSIVYNWERICQEWVGLLSHLEKR